MAGTSRAKCKFINWRENKPGYRLSGSYVNMAADRESLARTISDPVSRAVSDAINSACSQVSQNTTICKLLLTVHSKQRFKKL